MDQDHAEDIPLREQGSTLSGVSFGSNSTMVASPASPTTHRPGYRRVSSTCDESDSHLRSSIQPSGNNAQGLGILNLGHEEGASVSSAKVDSKDSPNPSRSTDFLLSPKSARIGSTIHRNGDSYLRVDDEDPYYPHVDTTNREPFIANSEDERLQRMEVPFCSSARPLTSGRTHWMTILTLILSVFSTVMSLIWLLIAIFRPQYGHKIGPDGYLTSRNASLVCAALAKLIELSFTTVFVAFLGQVLSRRALREIKGITIAEMSMRSWILQPGTVLTHWRSVRHGGGTRLGAVVLMAAITSMLYTTASDTLVRPKVEMSATRPRMLYGKVATSFANTNTLIDRCTTPIQTKDDPDSGLTCLQIQHSGEAFHNYMQYLGKWADINDSGNGSSSNLRERPEPVAMLYDNTTVKGSWIQVQNMTELSKKFSRITNNVTMAMPHSGVFKAARDSINDIVQPQPQDLTGLGEYLIQASVPSPVVNVLCANMSREDLMPMVYTEWPRQDRSDLQPDSTTWPNNFSLTLSSSTKQTVVDDLFNFDDKQIHPIFPKLPKEYKTVFNHSLTYGAYAVYLLAASPTNQYTLCSIRSALTPDCFTSYRSSATGGTLNKTCDPYERLSYKHSAPEAANGFWNKDWKDVASEWGKALSLNDGITDGKSSNARLLSGLIPLTTSLNPSKPSISEALAVLAGNTLLLSVFDSPFIHHWNYSDEYVTLKEPQYQAFNATVQSATYQSGGSQRGWRNILYLALMFVFIANVLCLLYFLYSGSRMTDFMEPENLFSLSLLSPPSNALHGTCASGPDKQHVRSLWHIKLNRERNHLWIDGKEGSCEKKGIFHRHKKSVLPQHQASGIGTELAGAYDKLRQDRISML